MLSYSNPVSLYYMKWNISKLFEIYKMISSKISYTIDIEMSKLLHKNKETTKNYESILIMKDAILKTGLRLSTEVKRKDCYL